MYTSLQIEFDLELICILNLDFYCFIFGHDYSSKPRWYNAYC